MDYWVYLENNVCFIKKPELVSKNESTTNTADKIITSVDIMQRMLQNLKILLAGLADKRIIIIYSFTNFFRHLALLSPQR